MAFDAWHPCRNWRGLIYLDPFAGVVTITILIAIVFATHGVTQIAFALRCDASPDGNGFCYRVAFP